MALNIKTLGLAIAASVMAGNAYAQTTYTVTDLEVGSTSYLYGTALNNHGAVAGLACQTTDFSIVGQCQAMVWSADNVTKLGTLGGRWSGAFAINSLGQVAGRVQYGGGSDRAFLYSGGAMSSLGTLAGDSSDARGINSAGQVAGITTALCPSGGLCGHAFLFSNGQMKDLGTLGGTYSFGFAVNDAGQVAGDASLPTDTYRHAFLYSNGSMKDLGTLGGIGNSMATAINGAGVVAGSSISSSGETHAFIYRNGAMLDIGSLGGGSASASINSSGDVVGTSFLAASSGVLHAFIYREGAMYDLNTLLDPATGSGWTIVEARGINDAGQIVANASKPGESRTYHAVLLTPVPEPSPSALFLTGLMALCMVVWHRAKR